MFASATGCDTNSTVSFDLADGKKNARLCVALIPQHELFMSTWKNK